MSGLNEVRKMLAEASRKPNGWTVADTDTVNRLHLMVERMADSIEELTAAATSMSLAIRINLSPEQIRFLPGMAGALEMFDAYVEGHKDA